MDLTQFEGKYTKEDLAVLEAIETKFQFEKFDSMDALKLGNMLVELSLPYPQELAVFIHRMKDECIIFQFVADSKAARNYNYASMKRNVVLKTGHCSLWGLVKSVCDEPLDLGDDAMPVGGAWPIYVNGEMVATVAISGLHEGADFTILVDAFSKFLDVQVPEFKGMIV